MLTADRVIQHLYLIGAAGVLTVTIGLILGILAYLYPKTRRPVLWVVDVLQTIPVLAMLGLLMIVFGATPTTVIIGLTLYSLLPVVRNTYVGLRDIDPALKEAALGMGMTHIQRLLFMELQLALPMILTGVRIAIVTSIGTAVFGAIVGGGGLGYVINRAILLQDMRTLLYATLILMVVSVVFDMLIGALESRLSSKHHVRESVKV